MILLRIINLIVFAILFAPGHSALAMDYLSKDEETVDENSHLIDSAISPDYDKIPTRPILPLELGPQFLDNGQLEEGLTLPTGFVMQPSFYVFGNYRTAIQAYYNGSRNVAQWANRLDLFGNLYLAPTERALIGVTPLSKKNQYSSELLSAPPNHGDRWSDDTNLIVNELFFEGDISQLFPNLDLDDKYGLDIGFAVGRQPLIFQDGILINDEVDSVGVSKINIRVPGAENMRSTFVWGGGNMHRYSNISPDTASRMFGTFNEIDFTKSTVDIDGIYVDSNHKTGDGVYTGLSATQYFGEISSTFRVLNSTPIGNITKNNKYGLLYMSQLGWTPPNSVNYVYMNFYRGIGDFRSASRDASVGAPLGIVGIQFASPLLGSYGSAISSQPDDSAGGALGYQMFFDDTRKQLTVELGGRYATNPTGEDAIGPGVSYKMAVGKRCFIRVDTFWVYDPNRSAVAYHHPYNTGGRLEFETKF